jgi:hypothetical protein
MANKDAPSGSKPRAYLNGAKWNGQMRKYVVLAADTTAVGKGDLVKLTGTSSSDGKYASVRTITATSDVIVGVVVGFEANPDNLNITGTFRSTTATTKDRAVFVVDDPNVIFEIQADGDMADNSIGLNAFPTLTTASTTTGVSTQELTASTVATDVNGQLRIVGLVNEPDNESDTTWQKVLVMINTHQYTSKLAGI